MESELEINQSPNPAAVSFVNGEHIQHGSPNEKATNQSPQTSRNKQKAFRSTSKILKRKQKASRLDRSILKLNIEERYPSDQSDSTISSETDDELIINSMMSALKNRSNKNRTRVNTRANTSLAIPKIESVFPAKEPSVPPTKVPDRTRTRKASLIDIVVKTVEHDEIKQKIDQIVNPPKPFTYNEYVFTSEHNILGFSHAAYKIKQGEYTLFCAKQKERNLEVNSPIFISNGTKSKQSSNNKHVGIFMAFNKITEFTLADIHDNVQYSSEQIKANVDHKNQVSLSLKLHTPRDKLEIQGDYCSLGTSESGKSIKFLEKSTNQEYITLTNITDSTWKIKAVSEIDPKQLLSLAIVIDHFSRTAKK